MAPAQSRPELVVITGTTASGKSDLAIKVAKKFDGEIICADSWTVYRDFNIGTSKPSQADQKAVKHWLLDVREAPDGFNAPMFKKLAEEAIRDIRSRSRLPIMVGGTGLYIDSVLYDFGFLPNTTPEDRAKLDKMAIPRLLELAKRKEIDLSEVDIRNKRRIIRAIEAGGQKPTRGKLRSDSLIIGLKIGNEELRQRVEKRTDKMVKAGLRQEVKKLSARYGWGLEPMKGIGYREWREYFEGQQTLEETKRRIISATMNLAKRQHTWLKRNPDVQWFDSATRAYSFINNTLNT